jgi:general secretion pathway protein G
MAKRPRRTSAFTLVEILIVVVILGILATLVIPSFSNASESAKASNAMSALQAVRTQLQVYQAQHMGKFPAIDKLWTNLTSRTNVSGAVVTTGGVGPYLKSTPKNPFTNSSTVVASGGTSTDGWVYNAATGAITMVGFNEITQKYTKP